MNAALTQAPTPAKPAAPPPVATGLLQRKCACGGSPGVAEQCSDCGPKKLAVGRSTRDSEVFARQTGRGVPAIVHEVLSSPGQPLDRETAAFMKPRFGHDFGQVRVHTDARAAESARAVNALAYTVGRNIVFDAGRYAPAEAAGRELLAYELAHVVQQSAATNSHPLQISDAHGASERAADTAAARALSAGSEGGQLPSTPVQIARQLNRNAAGPLPGEVRDAGTDAGGSGSAGADAGPTDGGAPPSGGVPAAPGDGGVPTAPDAGAPAPPAPPAAPCLPTFVSLVAAKTGNIAMTTAWPGGNCEMALGTPGAVGITFRSVVDVPAGCTGTLEYLQLCETCRQRRNAAGTNERQKGTGFLLDGTDPYSARAVTAPGRVNFNADDSPGTPTSGYVYRFVGEVFRMWLLWTPTGGVRVPLARVQWDWTGKTNKTGNSGGCAADWTISDAAAHGGTGAAIATLPTWTGRADNLPFTPGTC